jgi:hypothetical protein
MLFTFLGSAHAQIFERNHLLFLVVHVTESELRDHLDAFFIAHMLPGSDPQQ